VCGIAGGACTRVELDRALRAIEHRGPDGSGIVPGGDYLLGHVRLAVQDLTEAAAQPFTAGRTVVTFNGEAWQPARLRALVEDTHIGGPLPDGWISTGDTEPVAHLLDRCGVEALPIIRGMFALAWVGRDGDLYLARDAYGEIPLHLGRTRSGRYVYGSEIRAVLALGAVPASVQWVPPGYYVRIFEGGRQARLHRWYAEHRLDPIEADTSTAAREVRDHLDRGVRDRLIADVPVTLLCSGGLDSGAALGLALAAGQKIDAVYTAVHDPKSRDLHCARQTADLFGVELREVPVPAPDADALAALVRKIELPHKAQVEIAVACDALARRMAADGVKVVLSGEGSDELWASYGMAYHGIARYGWHAYRSDLFTGQHRKNFPRTNKVFMAHGIEARLPFLDPGLARYAMRLTQDAVTAKGRHPKAVLAEAVRDLLPADLRLRPKVAFQKGARLDTAASRAVPDPRAFYAAEFRTAFRGAKP